MSDHDDDKTGEHDPARARAAWAVESARIDKAHERFPRCVVCGNWTRQLDQAGCCPRISAPHVAHRAEVKAFRR